MRLKTRTKLAVASVVCKLLLALRRLVGLGSRVEVTRNGIHWQLDLNEGIDLAIYLFGRFESSTVHVFRRLIRRGDVVIDIGANIGANTLELARCVGSTGRVVAFEPTVFAIDRLRRNLELNPALAASVTLEQAILGDDSSSREPSEFYSSWPLSGSANEGVHERHRGQLKSAAGAHHWTLDRYVADYTIAAVRLIKLDVDGHELAVLRGAKETLGEFQPFIVMELAPYVLDEEKGTFEGILNLLRAAGYDLTEIPSGKHLPMTVDALREVIPDGASINVLAQTGTKRT